MNDHPIPYGWYVVARSADVRAGSLRSLRCFGRDVVLYRTAKGVVRAIHWVCPHLGAHLGVLGSVQGEDIECGFHRFRYGPDGRCTRTGYGGPIPAKARTTHYPVLERNGFVMVWYDPQGRPPEWAPPELPERGWTAPVLSHYDVATTPQETVENTVDAGHFRTLHGFELQRMDERPKVDGPRFELSYSVRRRFRTAGIRWLRTTLDYRVTLWGLGYSEVSVHVSELSLNVRLWLLSLPVDESHLRLGMAAAVPSRPLGGLVRMIAHQILRAEVKPDVPVWNTKAYLEQPALTTGDGPIAEYRRWARQFHL